MVKFKAGTWWHFCLEVVECTAKDSPFPESKLELDIFSYCNIFMLRSKFF